MIGVKNAALMGLCMLKREVVLPKFQPEGLAKHLMKFSSEIGSTEIASRMKALFNHLNLNTYYHLKSELALIVCIKKAAIKNYFSMERRQCRPIIELLLVTKKINLKMRRIGSFLIAAFLFVVTPNVFARDPATATGFTNAADYGFLPTESGINNTKALQAAVDKGGTIIISKAGTYKIAGTVYIGDSTSLVFGNKTMIQKSAEKGKFGYVFLNKGALTKTYNYHISITGLTLSVHNVDTWMGEIYGQRGQVSFVWVKDLLIEHFRCTDLSSGQFCIQVCTFEDLLINDVIIKGKKDGIHLGRGKRFRISNCIFQTADDAIALAAGDWISGNPELGDIEDGIIENCYDLKADILEGAFAKIVPAGWVDWKPGIEVRHGDAIVSNGKIYRVLGPISDKVYKSVTPPAFTEPSKVIDSIEWLLHQTDTFHTAVVRNVVFRDIFLESIRVPFQIMCYDNNYSHSYYRGAPLPVQGEIHLENITVLNDFKRALINISTPLDIITIRNSTLRNNGVEFKQARDMDDYLKTSISFTNCIFKSGGALMLISNNIKGKEITLKTSGSLETGENFKATVEQGKGIIRVKSDLTGLDK